MKFSKSIPHRPHRRNVRGFTLVEIMFVSVIFLVIVGAMVCLQIFALRTYTFAATKLVATAGGREALNQIRDQIRGGKMVYVGTNSSISTTSFSFVSTNSPQQGNALIIYPTTNLTWYSIYYLDTSTSTNQLIEFDVTNGNTIYSTNVLAKYVTNNIVFDMEDWQANIVTNEQSLDNRLLVRVTMQFSQWEYPIAVVGTNGANAYDYYQLRTRVFRRAWN